LFFSNVRVGLGLGLEALSLGLGLGLEAMSLGLGLGLGLQAMSLVLVYRSWTTESWIQTCIIPHFAKIYRLYSIRM